MKIIALNAYAGTLFEPIMAFVGEHKADTDVFCFQEILTTTRTDMVTTPAGNRANLWQELCDYLPEFEGRFFGMLDNTDTSFGTVPGIVFGLAIFVKKTLPITDVQELFVHGTRKGYAAADTSTAVGAIQVVQVTVDSIPLSVCNAHGAYAPIDKRDSPKRLEQSQKIIDVLQNRPGEKVIMGDFNLFPDTESIRMFEKAGYRNLVVEYKIPSTRGAMNKQLHPQFANSEFGFQEFADYTFVTPGMKVTGFEVPDLPLSDHLPMILEVD